MTESTFALPIYRWQPEDQVFNLVNQWLDNNAAASRASVLYGYSLGKAQRLIAGVDANIGPIVCHSAVQAINRIYQQEGVKLPTTRLMTEVENKTSFRQSLVIAPPAVHGSSWLKNFGPQPANAMASGWMTLRGARRRHGYEKGFALSDHADWPGLLSS